MRAWIGSSLLMALILFLSSCSIKEDRTDCPCILTVDLSNLLDTLQTPLQVWEHDLQLEYFPSDGNVIKVRIARKDANPEYDRKVKKGVVSVSAIMGMSSGRLKGTSLTYPEGAQSDPLYLYSETLMCDGEEARAILTMNKQYSKIRIRELRDLPGYDPEASFDNFKLVAKGSACGIDILDLNPLEGSFQCVLSADESGFHWFNMPRQLDKGIVIEMYDDSGRLCDELPLGKYLDEAGYDWDADSLRDVTLYLDRCSASVDIIVSDWDAVEEIHKGM